jgi:hypothetical protein
VYNYAGVSLCDNVLAENTDQTARDLPSSSCGRCQTAFRIVICWSFRRSVLGSAVVQICDSEGALNVDRPIRNPSAAFDSR